MSGEVHTRSSEQNTQDFLAVLPGSAADLQTGYANGWQASIKRKQLGKFFECGAAHCPPGSVAAGRFFSGHACPDTQHEGLCEPVQAWKNRGDAAERATISTIP